MIEADRITGHNSLKPAQYKNTAKAMISRGASAISYRGMTQDKFLGNLSPQLFTTFRDRSPSLVIHFKILAKYMERSIR